MYNAGNCQVAIIGAGHAGCEAAFSTARLGLNTILFTLNMDAIANMACNPNVGGTAKGHLVREIDALGGEMGKVADATAIQCRMLNLSKGPAVHSLRMQIDRRMYQIEMKKRLELLPQLLVKQAEIVDIIVENNKVIGVVTSLGALYRCQACIVATGTFLGGKIIIGDNWFESGPDGMFPANQLVSTLKNFITLRRFKTGTPARVDGKQLDYTKMQVQAGDEKIIPFSFQNTRPPENKVVCHMTYTNAATHELIRQNLHRAPLYTGAIEGTGPRYCPSIEDKIVRFKDKERHQIFIEPVGIDTTEMYVQGLSTSLPEDVQQAMLRTIDGLERTQMRRTGYAIEYYCCDSTELALTLEFKSIKGLFGAGQFNGTSGYEEAAAQGLMAGINAAHQIQGKPPLVLGRNDAYIGVLIDDLVTKGTNEPYRMMTARSEYRLLLRQDNADQRLTEIGHKIGLISAEAYDKFTHKQGLIEAEIQRLENTFVTPTINDFLVKNKSTPIYRGTSLAEFLRRPELDYQILSEIDQCRPQLPLAVCEQAQIRIKYEGYIKKQEMEVLRFQKMEHKIIPLDIDYDKVYGLRLEARQKLNKHRPVNIGQASRISGVSPADISVLLIYLR